MPTDRRLSNIWFNTEGSLHLISERILLDVALSREGTRSCNSVFSLGPNIIFIQILFNTGCQFGLFHLQQWRRGEISSDGSHPDWQPVSPGKPHLLCFQSLIFQIDHFVTAYIIFWREILRSVKVKGYDVTIVCDVSCQMAFQGPWDNLYFHHKIEVECFNAPSAESSSVFF